MNRSHPSPGGLGAGDRVVMGIECYLDPNVECVTETVVP